MNVGVQSNSMITTYPSTMTCSISNGKIISIDFYGNQKIIGVPIETYNELEQISKQYYDKLVELGAIVPPKTQEQFQQETMNMMSEIMQQMKNMKAEMEALKNDKPANNSEFAQARPNKQQQINVSLEASTTNVSRSNKPTTSN